MPLATTKTYHLTCDGPCHHVLDAVEPPPGWMYVKFTPVQKGNGDALIYSVAVLCPQCQKLALKLLTDAGFQFTYVDNTINLPKRRK